MDFDTGHFCFYLLGILLSVCIPVTDCHHRSRSHYNRLYYYYYYYEHDGNASMIAGSIIGGLIALCIIIAVIVVIVHACNCCKTHGVRGHTVRPTHISTVTHTPYNRLPQNGWYYLPATAPPYQPQTNKPPEYSTIDSNPPPKYEEITPSAPPTNTALIQEGRSTPAPPYS